MRILATRRVTRDVRELVKGRGARLNVLDLPESHKSLVLPTERGLEPPKCDVHPIGFVALLKVAQVRVSRHRARCATTLVGNASRVINSANS